MLVAIRSGEPQKDELVAQFGKSQNPNVQRYKGLGEMNPEQLWGTTTSH